MAREVVRDLDRVTRVLSCSYPSTGYEHDAHQAVSHTGAHRVRAQKMTQTQPESVKAPSLDLQVRARQAEPQTRMKKMTCRTTMSASVDADTRANTTEIANMTLSELKEQEMKRGNAKPRPSRTEAAVSWICMHVLVWVPLAPMRIRATYPCL